MKQKNWQPVPAEFCFRKSSNPALAGGFGMGVLCIFRLLTAAVFFPLLTLASLVAQEDTGFGYDESVEMVAARPFDFTLTGTGDAGHSETGGLQFTAPSLDIDNYDFDESGNNRFIVPKSSISDLPISVSGDAGWKGGAVKEGEEVYILAGHCRVEQGVSSAEGPRGVVRMTTDPDTGVKSVVLYLEKENPWEPLALNLDTSFLSARSNDQAWRGVFRSSSNVSFNINHRGSNELNPEEIYDRALAMDKESEPATVMVTQSVEKDPGNSEESGTDTHEVVLTASEESKFIADARDRWNNFKEGQKEFRRVRLMSRYERSIKASVTPDATDSSRNRYDIRNGFILMIEGITSDEEPVSDVIDISADQAVIWVKNFDLERGGTQSADQDLEIYMEGDIVFREGENVIYAQKMYYDAKNKVGLIKDTEMVVPVPGSPGGVFRINADTISQNGQDTYKATNAWVSTSAMGQPTYRLQSNSLTAEFRKSPLYNAETGAAAVDPETGDQLYQENNYVIAENNFVALGCVPIFYWPWMSMNFKNQSLYMREFQISNDSTFGTQVRTGWNPYQIFNMTDCQSKNTDWTIDLDYLSKRGFGHGTTYTYDVDTICGHKTRALGFANYYGIYDKGTDNLGKGRTSDPFPHSYRYRGIWKHKQRFDMPECMDGLLTNCCLGNGCLCDGWELNAQLGKSSDRNYLREYFEEEWFTNSNPETSLELKNTQDNWSLGFSASVLTDKFYTGTNQLPKLEHNWIAQPLLCKLLWYENTKVGYNYFQTTETPYSVEDQNYFRYLNWELANTSGSNVPNGEGLQTLSASSFNFASRHELDLPIPVGPGKLTPYVLGEYAFWGKGVETKNISRLYGRAGLRADLPVWKVDSDVSSRTWYLNGMAHKMNFGMDAYISGVNKDFSSLILYDQIDDWQVQDFRRQYSVTTFSNTYSPYRDSIPVRFDERYYALRQGLLGGTVASPYTELASDLQQVRFNWLNRWQTKRGPSSNRHIIDWITLDTGISLYPKKEQNFGETVGLLDYDARWHVGDRFSVLSSGLFDFFESGQQIVRAGVMTKRPGVSNFYLGVDRLGGPIDNTYLNAAVNYRMSQKWAASFSNSYDLAEGRNVGQELGVSRIGESFVWSLKLSNNESKHDWGISLNVLPIFIYSSEKFEEEVLGFGQM